MPPRRKDGKIAQHGVRRLKAIAFLKEKMVNRSNEAIAKQYGVSAKTVAKTLSWAEKAQVFVEIEDALVRDLAPMAVEALKLALVEGDADVALEVLKGLNILKKSHPVTAKDVKEQDDLVSYITQLRNKAELDANTTEGTLLEARQPLQLVGRPANDLIPGYSPELLGASASSDGVGVGTSLPAAGEGEHPADAERVSGGDRGANPETEAGESPHSDENRLPGSEGPSPEPAVEG
jgi:hypothetical protein